MTIHAYKNAAVSALSLTISTGAALGWAVPAQAASDYLLQLDGIPGESKIVTGAGPGAGPHVKKEKWIILESVQLGAERAAGGVNVASGDINGDGVSAPRDVKTGQSSGKRARYPVHFHQMTDQETAALLLPAVQKVREAAARMTPWTGCAAGQQIGSVLIKQKSTGKEGKILDPVVTTCATDSVSFNFTKIEWK
ncbi:hypothetical protein [Sphingorhabdus sp.]|uniref:hypothetical protein n=1 Tax=Sphingorhabdus sp. TaxID=1902408 RepID=UPI0035942611